MTYCVLLGVSIMSTEYLHHRNVAAALTIAVRRNEVFSGLIACHYAAMLGDGNREKLGSLIRLTLRMDSLLGSLLHFSRFGNADVSLNAGDLNQLLAEAVEIVGFRTINGHPQIVVRSALPTVRYNQIRCRQVFVNLLSNALHYTYKVLKRIEVESIDDADKHPQPNCAEETDNQTIYCVADNDIGIQSTHFEPIFKLFRRLHRQEEYGGGTGAGVTGVRKLVEQHGRKVWVASLPGHCTTFISPCLPLQRRTRMAAAHSRRTRRCRAHKGKPTL
jgi:two-component system, chemotaxis family, sensor kinase Cph1